MAIKEDIVKSVFSGSDIFSKYARKKFGVKEREPKKPSDKTPTKAETPKDDGVTQEAVTILKIIAKNTMAMPGIARDMNVLRQNLQKLVSLKGGDKATGADAYFLKADEREAALEAQKQRISPTPTAPGAPGKPAESSGLLGSIVSFFSTGFLSAIKTIFSPKMLLKALTRVFLPLAIVISLFSGIKDGFQRYKETGSFSQAIVAGLGGMLNFISFGLFGEDSLKKLWSSVSDFLTPITDTISNIFNGIKNFFLKLFGKDVQVEDVAPPKIEAPKMEMPNPKDFAVSVAKSSGASDEKSQDLGSIFEAAGKGDTKSLFEKAQQFAAKYPEPSPTEGEPTQQTSPTQQISSQAAPAVEAAPAASPSPVISSGGDTPMVEKHRKLAKEFSMGNPSSPEGITQEISYVQMKRDYYAANRDKAMELGMIDRYGEYDKIVGIYEARINELLDMQKSPKSSSTSPASPVSPPSLQADSGGTSAPAASVASSGGASPTMSGGASPSVSGSDVSTASSMVAEGQRMEAAADVGSVVNAPVNTNSMSAAGRQPSKIASAYDDEFAALLAAT